MSDTEKVEFASPGWIAAIEGILQRNLAGADLGGKSFTVSEEFTDAPAHLVTGGGTSIGWHFRVSEDGVEVFNGVLADADLRTTVDYNAVLPLARKVYGTTPEELAEVAKLRSELSSSGSMERLGDEAALPADLMGRLFNVHNDIAVRTL